MNKFVVASMATVVFCCGSVIGQDVPTAQGVYVKTVAGAWKSVDKAPMAQLGSKGAFGAAFSGGLSSVKAVCKLKRSTSPNALEGTHPVFYLVDLQAFYSMRDFVIVRLDQKKDHREQQYGTAHFASAKLAYKSEDVNEVKVTKISDTVFTVEPVADVRPGEYILAVAPGCAGYDFSVPQPKK